MNGIESYSHVHSPLLLKHDSAHSYYDDADGGQRLNTAPLPQRLSAGSRTAVPPTKPVPCTACGSANVSALACSVGPRSIVTVRDSQLLALALSYDGSRIATGLAHGVVMVHCVRCGQQLQRFEDHTEHVETIAFCPQAKYLASGSEADVVQVRNTKTSALLPRIRTTRSVTSVKFSPTTADQAPILAACTSDGTVTLHRLLSDDQPPALLQVVDFMRYVHSVSFSPDGKTLAVGLRLELPLLDVETGQTIKRLPSEGTQVVFSPSGDLLARCGQGRAITMLSRYGDGVLVTDIPGSVSVNDIAFSPDGRIMAIVNQNIVSLHDVESGDEYISYTHNRLLSSITFSPDGRFVMAGGMDGLIHIYRAPKETDLRETTTTTTTTAIEFQQFRATLPRDISDEEAIAAFRAAECGGNYAFPTWQTNQQRAVAAAMNEMQEEDDGLFALFASRVGQYTLPSSTTKALYIIWRMKHPDWTLDGKKREVLVKSIKEFCEKRLGAARSIAALSPSGNMDHRFAQLVVSPNNLQFKDDAARDAMHQSWVGFCGQAPSSESLDAIIEGFMRRVRRDEHGNASFDAAVLPLYWPKYTKREEAAVANAVRESCPVEAAGNVRICDVEVKCQGNSSDVEKQVVIKNLYKWFQHKLGRRGLTKATINKTYALWKVFLAEKKMEHVKNANQLGEVLNSFMSIIGLV